MYFLVNISPPKLLDIATSNFADAYVTWGIILCKPKVKSKIQSGYMRWCTIDCSLVDTILGGERKKETNICLNYLRTIQCKGSNCIQDRYMAVYCFMPLTISKLSAKHFT